MQSMERSALIDSQIATDGKLSSSENFWPYLYLFGGACIFISWIFHRILLLITYACHFPQDSMHYQGVSIARIAKVREIV